MPQARAEITGWTALRGIAALWVVMFHYQGAFTPEFDRQIFRSGDLGVELFFILSGAVMYYVYGQALAEGDFSYRHFLVKRFARLYPVHLVTMFAAAAIIFGLPLVGLRQTPDYGLFAALAVNLTMLQSFPFLDGLSLNYPSWSISAEFLAYMAFPALAILLISFGKKIAALACLVAFAVAEAVASRITGQCLGCGVALTHLTYEFSVLRVIPEFFAGLVGAAIAFDHAATLKRYAAPVVAASVAVILVAASLGSDLVVLVAAIPLTMSLALWDGQPPRALLWLGRISYSLYMSHMVAKMFLIGIVERLGGYADGEIPSYLLPPVILVCIGIAALLFYMVEQPGQKWILRVMSRRGAAVAARNATPTA